MGIQAEWRKESEARKALPKDVRGFYRGRFEYDATPAFLGLECVVCKRPADKGHRPSCPVPRAERALAKVAADRARRKEPAHADR
jgi:hypothetical protein